jgi:hypothetical protein
MKLFKLILILGLVTFLLKSCVPEVPVPNQEKIHLGFTFVYNKTISKSTALAAFKQNNANGTSLELINPANILYHSNLLIYNIAEGFYKKEFIGRIESNFVYTDLDNETLTNHVILNDSIAILTLSDSHSISSNLILPISAPNFLANERLEVELLDLNSGSTITLNSDSILSGNMMIEMSYLAQIGIGDMIITLRRIKEVSSLTESKDAGGNLKICYEVQDTVSLY